MKITLEGTNEELAALALELASKGLSLSKVPNVPSTGESPLEAQETPPRPVSGERLPVGITREEIVKRYWGVPLRHKRHDTTYTFAPSYLEGGWVYGLTGGGETDFWVFKHPEDWYVV